MSGIVNQIRSHPKMIGAVTFWVIILVIIRQYMQINDLTFNELTNQLAFVLTDTWYGPLIFITVYFFRPLILFPASLLTLLGGSVFGLIPGTLIVLVGGTLSSIIPYGVGRVFTSKESQDIPNENRLQRFVTMLQNNPFQAVLIMRLVFLPYDAVSVLAGSLQIPLRTFLLATFIGNISGTLAYVGIGSSLKGDITTGDISLDINTLLFSGVILTIALALSYIINQFSVNPTTSQE